MIPILPSTNEVKSAGDVCVNCGQAMAKLENQFMKALKWYSGVACANSACACDVYANAADNIFEDEE